MKTELDLIKSARGQYQCAYKQMARGGAHDLFYSPSGVVLDRAHEQPYSIAVRDVQCMGEETMVLKLVASYRSANQEILSKLWS